MQNNAARDGSCVQARWVYQDHETGRGKRLVVYEGVVSRTLRRLAHKYPLPQPNYQPCSRSTTRSKIRELTGDDVRGVPVSTHNSIHSPSLLSLLFRDLAGDELLHDLVGAAVDLLHTAVSEGAAHGVLPHVAPAAVELHAVVSNRNLVSESVSERRAR